MFKKISLLLFLLTLLILPYLVFAQSPTDALKQTGNDAGFAAADDTSVSKIAGTVVATALSLLGIIFIILIIYGGVRWMMAQGNEQEVETAKNVIKNSIIGLIIVVGAYAIYNLVSKLITG